ncbi:hypothetical protein FQR65_LT00069 [Abscondita terminalis]|nr:hypothetical protein FQR65_LT00069 [Abscondita terminalis]
MRTCWDQEGIALLNSRYVFENVLPNKNLISIKDNTVVNDLVAYFRLLLNLVRKSATGTTRHLLILAMSDAIGGYLHRFILPISRYAYYTGFVRYDSMEKLYTLFGNIKDILRTNGNGWSDAHYSDYPLGGITIPLPFSDSPTNPESIALPLKSHSLVSLTSKHSQNVFVKYYIAAIECLKSLNATENDIKEFNSEFMNWLGKNVLPHLYKDTFYVGFGGVLQIVETMKDNGVERKQIDSYKAMAEEEEKEIDEFVEPEENKSMIIIALLATILMWVLLGCLFICCRLKTGKCKKEMCKESMISCSCNSERTTTEETQPSSTEGRRPSTTEETEESVTTSTRKSRETYESSSSIESRKGSETPRRRRKEKSKFIYYMETKDGFPLLQKPKSKKSMPSSPTIGIPNKISPNNISETRIGAMKMDKSLETIGLTSSSDKTSRNDAVGSYRIETTSTTSETIEEEEEEEESEKIT